ncbi:MAG TPA: hypothetical protein DDW23_05420 [Planctomycetes bacterium]|nr:hypothetical protein [Planctomycetota bacterium]|tara:strand:- start:69 stop:821 length:753 start_codon:yes stop_codon:yes gene_type:complete
MHLKHLCNSGSAFLLLSYFALILFTPASEERDLISPGPRLDIRGWTVHVDKPLNDSPKLRDEVLRLLNQKLWEVEEWLPSAAVQRLKKVNLWMRLNEPSAPGGVYHPSRTWLLENERPPEMAGGIEFGNAKNFLSWARQQPSMVLHELAHAWHHQVLGYEYAPAKTAYQRARESGNYADVLYVMGGKKSAYALNNVQEFFAELSEAYWGTNDFFPFVRAELLVHDAESALMIQNAWTLSAGSRAPSKPGS